MAFPFTSILIIADDIIPTWYWEVIAYGVVYKTVILNVLLQMNQTGFYMLKEIDEKGTQVDVVLNNAGLQIGYRADYLNTPIKQDLQGWDCRSCY